MNQTEKDLAAAKIEAAALAQALYRKHYKSVAPDWGLCDSVSGIISQIDNMVSTLVKPSGWISVEDRLPSPNTGVLVFNRYKFIACIEEDGRWFSAEDYATLFQVTHWQPLPSDPQPTS
jgi:hypothetical protein